MYDILTFGSVTLDSFITPEKDFLKRKNFVIPAGEKIILKDMFKSCGGSSANTSVGFVKLGLKTGTYGFIGDDRTGKIIKNIFKEEGLETKFLLKSPHSKSSVSVVLQSHQGERTLFHYRNPMEDYDPIHLTTSPKTKAIYIGHLTQKSEDFLFAIPEWKQKTTSLVVWNPGKTQFEKGFHLFNGLFPFIDVLILNKEEAEQFTKIKSTEISTKKTTTDITGTEIPINNSLKTKKIYDLRRIANKFLKSGVKKVIITDGIYGTQVFTNDYHFRITASKTQVVSSLGAGDGFAVGVLSAILYKKSPEEQLLWGLAESNAIISIFGAQNGQLTKKEIEKETTLLWDRINFI